MSHDFQRINETLAHLHDQRLAMPPSQDVKAFQDALLGDMGDGDAWWRYGIALSDFQWQNRDAADAVSLALAIDPLNAAYHQFRGYCHLKLGFLQEAAADFSVSLKLDPQYWGAAYYLGMTYFYMEEYGRALGVYDRMWEMTPPSAQWAAYCNWYYLTARKVGDGQRAAYALSKTTPDAKPVVSTGTLGNTWDDAAYLNACKVYAGWLKPEEVLAGYREKGENSFDYFMISLLLGLYFEVEGRAEEARALFQDIVDRGVGKVKSPAVEWIVEKWLRKAAE